MPNWNNVKIKYQQEQENGALKTIVEAYLLDAVSFTDAEARAFKIFIESIPEFTIISITKAKFSEVINDTTSEHFYVVKYSYISINEITNHEKRIPSSMLVRANDIEQALEFSKSEFSKWLIPIEIEGITLTSILEVYPFIPDE